MNFICVPCRTAADIITHGSLATRDIKKRGHENCKGNTWCDCQHRVGKQ